MCGGVCTCICMSAPKYTYMYTYIYIYTKLSDTFAVRPACSSSKLKPKRFKKIKLKNALQLKSRMHNYRQLTVYFPRALWSGDVAYVGVEQRVQLFVSA